MLLASIPKTAKCASSEWSKKMCEKFGHASLSSTATTELDAHRFLFESCVLPAISAFNAQKCGQTRGIPTLRSLRYDHVGIDFKADSPSPHAFRLALFPTVPEKMLPLQILFVTQVSTPRSEICEHPSATRLDLFGIEPSLPKCTES